MKVSNRFTAKCRIRGLRFWCYRMPWTLNYRRPCAFRLADGFRVECLSLVFMVAR
jgi:hypothetical protein